MERTGALAPDVRDPFVGSVILVVFGLVFVVVNSGELPTAWSLGIRLAAVLIAVVLVVALCASSATPRDGRVRRFRWRSGAATGSSWRRRSSPWS